MYKRKMARRKQKHLKIYKAISHLFNQAEVALRKLCWRHGWVSLEELAKDGSDLGRLSRSRSIPALPSIIIAAFDSLLILSKGKLRSLAVSE